MIATPARRGRGPWRIVLGVVGDDVHAVGNQILDRALAEAGFRAYNLGTRTPPERFVAAALEVEAHAVLVASLNGGAEYWCSGFRRRFEDAGLGAILLYLGGNLAVGERRAEDVLRRFADCGFDRVFHRQAGPSEVIDLLRRDLENGPPRG